MTVTALQTESPVALIFPGQGVQHQGMGLPWRDTGSWSLLADISEWSGHDVEELVLRADEEALRRTDLAQIAVFAVSIVALCEARRAGLGPAIAYAGHSLGEFTALVASGALSLKDGCALVATRGAAMREAARQRPGRMVVILRSDREAVEKFAGAARERGHGAWVANVNGPGQVTVSGTEAGVGMVTSLAVASGLVVAPLPVGGGFHSPLMEDALPELRLALSAAKFTASHSQVVANVDGRPHTRGCDWPALEERQLTSPVLWERSVLVLIGDLGCRLVEVGPGGVLARLAARISPGAHATSIASIADVEELARSTGDCTRVRNSSPAYPLSQRKE